MAILPRSFYARPTVEVARDLLGQILVRVEGRVRLAARIVETEAYVGEDDAASHAARGLTRRNAPMFGPPGHAYIYKIYGFHHCLNIVTERTGYPAAVLIRAAEPLAGLARMRRRRGVERAEDLASGPGKLGQAFGLTLEMSGMDMTRGDFHVEPGARAPEESIAVSRRVGIVKAVEQPWRFYLAGNPNVSRGPRAL